MLWIVQRLAKLSAAALLGLMMLSGHGGAATAANQQAMAAEANDEPTAHQEALDALRDGLPELAAIKASRLIPQLRETQRQTAALIAVEAWIRARNGAAALAILDREKVPNAEFWRAQALALSGEIQQARKDLEQRLGQGRATHQEQVLLAQIFMAQQEPKRAMDCLAPLLGQASSPLANAARELHREALLMTGQAGALGSDLNSDTSARATYMLARAMVERGQEDQAIKPLEELTRGGQGGPSVQQAAQLLLAELERRHGALPQAILRLNACLNKGPLTEHWPLALQCLQRCLSQQPEISPPGLWFQWLERRADLRQPSAEGAARQQYALLLLGRWLLLQKQHLESLGLAETLLQIQPPENLQAEAIALALESHFILGHSERSRQLLDQWFDLPQNRGGPDSHAPLAQQAFRLGTMAMQRGDFKRACRAFALSSDRLSSTATQVAALQNAALAALQSGERGLYQTQLIQLQKQGDAKASAEIELERALWLATQPKSNAEALSALRAQLKLPQSPDDEALLRLTLAETLLGANPPQAKEAQLELSALQARAPNLEPDLMARLQLANLRRLEAAGEYRELCLQAEAILRTNPDPDLAALLGMKIAQAYHQLENYAAAKNAFEGVARLHPTSPHAETALYFAGICAMAMLSDEGRSNALALWQQVADKGGALAITARQQQISALRRFGQEAAALQLVEALIAAPNLNRQLRWSMNCEMAELQMIVGQKQKQGLDPAITTLRQLLKQPDLDRLWRARAGYTLAMALQQSGNLGESIEACYDVIAAPDFTRNASPTDYQWYYRAGFLGVELLEKRQQWEAAARLAEKLAQSSGNRAAEARERATKIRLEHFLWENR